MNNVTEFLPFLVPLVISELALLAYTLYHILTHKRLKQKLYRRMILPDRTDRYPYEPRLTPDMSPDHLQKIQLYFYVHLHTICRFRQIRAFHLHTASDNCLRFASLK